MKPIFLSDEEKQKLIQEFTEHLDKQGMQDGKLTFSRDYSLKDQAHSALVTYTPAAFAKMVMLIMSYNSEVAWYCLIKRGEDPETFIVYDVLVYPQKVTGVTVDTDDSKIAQFYIDLDKAGKEQPHCQCHSHVNMGTSASSRDLNNQKDTIAMMGQEGFYLFQIWNKKLEHTSFLYDFDNNLFYEDKDIELDVADDDGCPLSWFIEDSQKMVVSAPTVGTSWNTSTPSYSKPATGYYDYQKGAYVYPAPQTKKEKKAAKKAAKAAAAYGSGMLSAGAQLAMTDLDEDDDGFPNDYGDPWYSQYPYGITYS